MSALAASNWSGTTASKILHSSLVDQLYTKEVCFCSFVTESNQACIKYSPICILQFLSDHHTWESHGIIYKEILLSMVTPLSNISTCLPTEIPPNRQISYQRPTTLPRATETTPVDTWSQSLITKFLSFNPPQYKSKRHKQDLLITTTARFLIACSNFQIIKS